MATARTFQDMLNEYLTNKLLKNEFIKRSYFLQHIERDDKWKGGDVPVPFKAANATSVKMGGITPAAQVNQAKYVRGKITGYKEMWCSMRFNHRDIIDHSGRVNEDSFLSTAMECIEDSMSFAKMLFSIQISNGNVYSLVTSDVNAATGVLEVSRVDRFELGQKIGLIDNNTALAQYYVIAIDINAGASGLGTVTLSATPGGAAADVSAYTVAQEARFHTDGADTNNFQSLRKALLSAANNGDSTIHGQSKIAYPYLQAVNVDGTGITAANLLDKIFDAFAIVKTKARDTKMDKAVMSFKHWGSAIKAIESKTNGAANWNVDKDSKKASVYGWSEITIQSVDSGKSLTLVGIQEFDDDIIMLLDFSSFKFLSNGFFKKRVNPKDGSEFFEVRDDVDGYYYLVDMFLFGELMVHKPGANGIIHSINY